MQKYNLNILKQFKAIAEENNWDSDSIQEYNGMWLEEEHKKILKEKVPELTNTERVISLLASCELWEGDKPEDWKETLDNNENEKEYDIEIVKEAWDYVEQNYPGWREDDYDGDEPFFKYFVASRGPWGWDFAFLERGLGDNPVEIEI